MSSEYPKVRKHTKTKGLLLIFLLVITLYYVPNASATAQYEPLSQPIIYVVSIEGTIEPGLASYVKRVLNEAENAHADAILVEVNTFGGRVDAATEIRDYIVEFSGQSIAYVKGRAWSAGALITLAAEKIAMARTASIGAAETIPKEEKQISALRGEFEATAENRGRDAKIAAAMVDADIAIEGLIEAGKLLTLTAQKGKELGFIDLIANSREEVLEAFGLADAEVREPVQNWAEKLARFLTDPTVSSILLVLGFLGLLFEVTSPGWGVPGTVGVLALFLFFGGRLVIGLAGWGVIGLFILGFALLLIEVFIIPGFGVTGISGIIAIFASLVLSFRNIREASFAISFAMIISFLVIIVMAKRLGKSKTFGKLVLSTTEHTDDGYVATPARHDYVGKVGRTLTFMRPSGTVIVDGERIDAVTEGDFLGEGCEVEVIKVEGPRVVVRAYKAGCEGGNQT
ncbi:MAG: nodulation protein NfeD [Firmicutes bacterium]|nr:nodulation protein NfeD [Bacillota bacterium]HXL03718.1 nodulation protein NfeD [Bacillota bacterium]